LQKTRTCYDSSIVLMKLLQLELLDTIDSADYDITSFLSDDQDEFYWIKDQVSIYFLFFLFLYSFSQHFHFLQIVSVGIEMEIEGRLDNEEYQILMAQSLTGIPTNDKMELSPISQYIKAIPYSNLAKRDLYYTLKYLPYHLLQTGDIVSVGEVLADGIFIKERFQTFGPHIATQMQISDLHLMSKTLKLTNATHTRSKRSVPQSWIIKSETLDLVRTYRHVLTLTRDEVYTTESSHTFYSPVLGLCMICIGEALLQGDNARDAIYRLDEAASIYRLSSGCYKLDIAKSLDVCARACIKVGEERLALVKYEEAWRIYHESKNLHSFDVIQNCIHLKDLLVSFGFYSDAETKYEHAVFIHTQEFGEESLKTGKGSLLSFLLSIHV